MIIIEDSNNKVGRHNLKNAWWLSNGYEVVRYRLPVADYVLMNDKIQDVLDRKAKRGIPVKMMDFMGCYDVACDSKNSILELCTDLQTEHQRFKDSLILAQNNGIKLYIVVENKGTYLDSIYLLQSNKLHTEEKQFDRLLYRTELTRNIENNCTTPTLEAYRQSMLEYLENNKIEFMYKDFIYYLENKNIVSNNPSDKSNRSKIKVNTKN